ncbi:hypothetical protein BSKO_09564 [Bryopsis sp. KO-2023]|nr:hypothetical protein BSKO_09564 [Bryopsis sp. KO-2023]
MQENQGALFRISASDAQPSGFTTTFRKFSERLIFRYRRTPSGKTEDDVVSRMEILPDKTAKYIFRGIYVGVFMSLLLLVSQVVMKSKGVFKDGQASLRVGIPNLIVGGICMVTLLSTLGRYSWRVNESKFEGQWSLRRRRWTYLQMAELSAQCLNSIFFVIPNILLVTHGELEVRSGPISILMFLRFTMWNTIFFLFVLQARVLTLWVDGENRPLAEEDGILLDAPWSSHWFLVLFWLAFEACFIVGAASLYSTFEITKKLTEFGTLCGNARTRVVITLVILLSFMIYEASVLYYIRTCFSQLKRKPYNTFRWIHIKLRCHLIQVLVVGGFVILTFFSLAMVRLRDCHGTMLVFFGIVPGQLAMTCLSVANAYLMMPVKMGKNVFNIRHSIVWREKDMQAERASCVFPKCKLSSFCFETALKLWYFSLLAYRVQSENDEITVEVAKKLYELDHHEVVIPEGGEIVVVICWSCTSSKIVVSFRGTDSAENVLSDLRAWRKVHPPARLFLGNRPLVHNGFLDIWEDGGLKHIVLNRVIQIVHDERFHKHSSHLMFTGHSMGGALAVLAAADVVRYCGVQGKNVTCHTFGAPRIGNMAFVREYNLAIRDTWQIVNGNDVVPTMPKFGPLFAHVGKRVIINRSGDIILNPLFIESKLNRFFQFFRASNSVGCHMMRSYKKSLIAIGRAQFIKRKGLPGGMRAVQTLMDDSEGGVFKLAFGVQRSRMIDLHNLGTFAWKNIDKKATINWSEKSSEGSQRSAESEDDIFHSCDTDIFHSCEVENSPDNAEDVDPPV